MFAFLSQLAVNSLDHIQIFMTYDCGYFDGVQTLKQGACDKTVAKDIRNDIETNFLTVPLAAIMQGIRFPRGTIEVTEDWSLGVLLSEFSHQC